MIGANLAIHNGKDYIPVIASIPDSSPCPLGLDYGGDGWDAIRTIGCNKKTILLQTK